MHNAYIGIVKDSLLSWNLAYCRDKIQMLESDD